MIVASVFLGLSMTGIMLLVTDVAVGIAGAVIVAAGTGVVIAGLWFALPLRRRWRDRAGRRPPSATTHEAWVTPRPIGQLTPVPPSPQ